MKTNQPKTTTKTKQTNNPPKPQQQNKKKTPQPKPQIAHAKSHLDHERQRMFSVRAFQYALLQEVIYKGPI